MTRLEAIEKTVQRLRDWAASASEEYIPVAVVAVVVSAVPGALVVERFSPPTNLCKCETCNVIEAVVREGLESAARGELLSVEDCEDGEIH